MKKTALSLSALVLAVLLLVVPASADTLNLVLANPVQYGSSGSTLTFDATLLAPLTNGATVFLNSDSFNFSGPGTIDDSDFLFNYPLTLDPGDSFTGALFTLTLPANFAIGTYSGYFQILGGADDGSFDPLATVNFQVGAVPEPSTWLLLATGLGLLTVCAIKRRQPIQTVA